MAEENKKFAYLANMFVDSDDDRKKLYEALDTFQSTRDMLELANTLKKLLNKNERLRIYDAARALIPIEHQMDYNLMTPYVNHKSRTVKMTRRKGFSYGFAIRGGKEHGTGIFISEVDSGSDAQTQGLRVGDQIIRVNGFSIDEAVHEEVINLLKSRNALNLKVKSVGMIPVKKRGSDVVTWKTVVDPNDQSGITSHRRKTSSSASAHSGEYLEFRVTLNVGVGKSFGCNICKGPTDLPGIFIQTIKDGGLACKAGLRPGDQLLEANGMKLHNVQFHEAVEFIKSFDEVELLVRKGVAAYLFPGESSGYNSSNSSVTEENGGEADNSLAAVKEENGVVSNGETKSIRTAANDDDRSEIKALGQLDDVIAAGHAARTSSSSSQSKDDEQLATTTTTWSDKSQLETFKREEEQVQLVRERMAEKMRTIEYASRLEAQQVDDDDIIYNASELLLRRRRTSRDELTTSEDKVGVDDLGGAATDADADVDNFREVLRSNVERTETGATNRSGTSPATNVEETSLTSNDAPSSNEAASTNRNKQCGVDRWQKTILAEVHNTPSPSKLKNCNSQSVVLNTLTEASVQSTLVGKHEETSSQSSGKSVSNTNRNPNENQQQRNQHDQLIEEFKKVHQKMICQHESEDDETPKPIVRLVKKVEMVPVSILKKKPAPVRMMRDPPPERPSSTTTTLSQVQNNNNTANNSMIYVCATTHVPKEVKELDIYPPKSSDNGIKKLSISSNSMSTPPVLVTFKSKPPASITPGTAGKSSKVSTNSAVNGQPRRSSPVQAEASMMEKAKEMKQQQQQHLQLSSTTTTTTNSVEIVAIKNGKTKAITDSSLRIPKPPNYFFPKSKTPVQVIVQSYQSGGGANPINGTPPPAVKPAPQRLEFLKSHPSIEIELASNNGQSQKGPSNVTSTSKASSKKSAPAPPAGVTKIVVNKSPLLREVQAGATEQGIKMAANSNSSNSNVRQAIEKFKAANNDRPPATTATSNNIPADRVGATRQAAPPAATNGKFQADVSIKTKQILAMSAVQPNAAKDVDDDRLTRRQRTPTVGDHRVSIHVLQEPVVIISSQQ